MKVRTVARNGEAFRVFRPELDSIIEHGCRIADRIDIKVEPSSAANRPPAIKIAMSRRLTEPQRVAGVFSGDVILEAETNQFVVFDHESRSAKAYDKEEFNRLFEVDRDETT